jgi:DNA-binding NtrC family response regulator
MIRQRNFALVSFTCRISIPMAPRETPRILLVDDERALLLSYRIIFERAGYSVVTAETTAAALALLNQQAFDVLLCDLTMERENSGLVIISAARKIDPDLRIVLMTGYSEESVPQQVIDSEVNLVFKPLEIPRLLETIDFLIRGHKRHGMRKGA